MSTNQERVKVWVVVKSFDYHTDREKFEYSEKPVWVKPENLDKVRSWWYTAFPADGDSTSTPNYEHGTHFTQCYVKDEDKNATESMLRALNA